MPAAWERDAPAPRLALRPTNDDGTERTSLDIGRSIVTVCKDAYDAHDWIYREVTEIGAMVNGAQFGFWNKAQQRFVSVADSTDENVIRIPVNQLKPAGDQATAMMTAERPIFGASAATSEGSNSAAAEMADAIMEHLWRFHCLGEMYRDTANGAFNLGTDFVLVEWDTEKGGFERKMSVGEDGVPVDEWVPLGDCKFTVVQRDQVAFDPAAKHPQDGAFVSIRRSMSRAYLMEAYPDHATELRKNSDRNRYERSEDYLARYSPALQRADSAGTEVEDALLVYTVFYSATRTMPKGKAFIVTDDGLILHEGDNDVYPTDEELEQGEQWPNINWPLLTFRGDRRGNSPWGRGRMLDAIPIQKAINGMFSKAIQHYALIANAKPFLPKGLDFKWSDAPGQVIRYSRAYSPASFGYLSPPQAPEYMSIVAIGREMIENIIGINAASNGSSPTADASGRLSENLQQRDQTRIAPIKSSIDEVWAQVMTYALRLMRRYASGKRRIQIVGENGTTALKLFDKSALAAGTDVLVYNDQSIPRDPSRRMLWLMNFSTMLANAKDEQQRALMLDLARLRDFRSYLEKQSPHRVKALRHNRMIELGEVPIPSPWDHALTHRATLEEYLCSEAYEQRVIREKREGMGESQTEEVAGYLWEHYSEQLAMQMGGAPPSGSGGGPPGAPPQAPQPGPATPQAGQVEVPGAIPAMTAPSA